MYKLFYFLLGCTPEGRHTEQHDVFFCIAKDVAGCIPHIKNFWPGGHKIHVDFWREVTVADGFKITVIENNADTEKAGDLFFINLGVYLPGSCEEHHFKLLTVADTISQAMMKARQTDFYKNHHTGDPVAVSHIDNKYGVDIDDVKTVKEILPALQKQQFSIRIQPPETAMDADVNHVGYFALNELKAFVP